MFRYQITFESPWYLLLLALVPVLWWYSFRGLVALGPARRLFALGLRTLVMLLFIMALAEIQMVHTRDRLTVIYLLDQSLSIPVESRKAMIQYVNEEVAKHRREEDRAGVIVFGRDAAIEIPPFDDDVNLKLIESLLDPNYTDLSTAMRLAQASFPEDASRRIVLVTDGNENLGDVAEQAQGLSDAGVGIDVVPVRYHRRGEVILERVVIPSNVRKGQPFDLRVVLSSTQDVRGDDKGFVKGRLVVRKQVGDQSVVVSDNEVELPPGKRVYTIRQEVDQTGFYTYEARFTLSDDPEADAMRENNRATTFTHIRGTGQVLLIEDYENVGQYDRFIRALEKQSLEVVRRPSDQLFNSLGELQQFDSVVIANVPREHFTDAQISMLVRNTQWLGSGLIMLGAPNCFGAGGWSNTELEKAMPVDFQIKSAKVVPRGALAMVMHASEMAKGNYWQKKIAEEALKTLGPRDYCGVIHYGGQCKWLWNPGMCTVGGNRSLMVARISRMTPGDMPDFDPGLKLAQIGFAKLPDAAVKHMIVISDGDPSPPSSGVVNALKKLKVTVSTVAIGVHRTVGTLKKLAADTGGKFYPVRNAKTLPKIFQQEARRVAQPLVYENKDGMRPAIRFPHEMIGGLDGSLPPFTGFVLTTKKENPLVEVSLIAPQPGPERNRTLLASWTYGLGKAVAFTTDAGFRYTNQWTQWENYDKLFGQIVAWSMRPIGDEGQFTVATDVQDGRVRVVINALDKNEEFLNFLDMSGTVVGPDLEPVPMKMEQVAPGRYVGTFPGTDSGSYFIMVNPGPGKAPIRTGIAVPYSDEFRGRATNEALLGRLAGLVPDGGTEGRMIEGHAGLDDTESLLAVDTFRHDLAKAKSSQDIWYYLVLLGSCVFFFDVFVRRVHVGFDWVPVMAVRIRDRVFGRKRESTEIQTIERLRGRKAEVEGQVEQFRASARFEASSEDVELAELADAAPTVPASKPTPPTEQESEGESYTERLLRAKKRAWEQNRD